MVDYDRDFDGSDFGAAGTDSGFDGETFRDRIARLGLDTESFVREDRPRPYDIRVGTVRAGIDSRSIDDELGSQPTLDAGPASRHVVARARGNGRLTPRDNGSVKEVRPNVRVQPDRRDGERDSDRLTLPVPAAKRGRPSDSGRVMVDGAGDIGPGAVDELSTPSITASKSAPLNRFVSQTRRDGFVSAVFEGAIGNIKFGPTGELIITLVVPMANDIDEALKLREAFGIMIQVGMYRRQYAREHGMTNG